MQTPDLLPLSLTRTDWYELLELLQTMPLEAGSPELLLVSRFAAALHSEKIPLDGGGRSGYDIPHDTYDPRNR